MNPGHALACAAAFTFPAAIVHADDTPPYLEEIVVVASKIEQPLWRVAAQVTSLTRGDLELQQARGIGDFARYQAFLEDERSSRFGSTGLSIRGVGGNRVTLELDGVPMPSHFAIGEFSNSTRNMLDAAVVERVEILRGPASVVYGSDALGGVVAMMSTAPRLLAQPGRSWVGGSAGYDSADRSRYVSLASAGSFAYGSGLLSLSRHDGHERDAAGAATDDLIDFATSSIFGRWDVALSPADRLRVIAEGFERDAESDLKSPLGFGRQFASTVALLGDDSQRRHRFSVDYARHDIPLADAIDVRVFGQRNETTQLTHDFRTVAGSSVPGRLIDREFSFTESGTGVELLARRELESRRVSHDILAGFEWEQSRLTEYRDGVDTDLASGATTKRLPPGELLPQRDLPRTTTDAIALYVQDELAFGRLRLIPAVRWDRFDLDARTDHLFTDAARLTDLANTNTSFRFGATWHANDDLALYAHYAEGFRAPPAEDVNLFLEYQGFVRVRALPNPALRAEQSQNYEVGIKFDGTRRGYLAIGLYESRFDDLIESRAPLGIDPEDGALLFQSRNVDRARIRGIEASYAAPLGGYRSPLRFAVDLHAARGDDLTTRRPLNFVNPARAVARLTWREFEPLSASLVVNHATRQDRVDFDDGSFFVAPSHTTIDVLGRWAPSPHVDLTIALRNLTDRTFWRYGEVRVFAPDDPRVPAMSQPGRSVALTLKLNN